MRRVSWVFFLFLFLTSGFGAGQAFAGMSGHYFPGIEGIKAGTPPPQGFLYKMYNTYYQADTLKDTNGDELNVGFDSKVFINCHRFIYNSDIEIFGGNLGGDLIVPIVYQDLSIDAFGYDDSRTGLCDLFVEPFAVSWVKPQWEALVSMGMWLPTGNFQANSMVSPGKGFYTFMLTAGATYYFDKDRTWAASVLGHYEINGKQEDTNVTPGDVLTVEWGISKTIARIFDVGISGYAYWQVSNDKGTRVFWDKNAHEKAYAVGPEIVAFIPPAKLFISLRHLFEFEVEDRPEGMTTVLSFVKMF